MLKKLMSPGLEKALVFLDERLLGATSNAVERGNRRYRKMQKTVYRVRTKEAIEGRLALDLLREQSGPGPGLYDQDPPQGQSGMTRLPGFLATVSFFSNISDDYKSPTSKSIGSAWVQVRFRTPNTWHFITIWTERISWCNQSPNHSRQNSLSEIRQERLLGDDENSDFPPCKVEIVLGANGRLYVVLPTGVETALPFACNAPFIQDPARLKIKDPETSPTNRWLLRRIGSLAASAMMQWLERTSLGVVDRSHAYSLLPDIDREDNSLEGICATLAEESFDTAIQGRAFILTNEGTLGAAPPERYHSRSNVRRVA